ncbi:MAG: hypothetical protein ACI4WH_02935 [Oscillospiraceae bacterium]
MGQSLNNCQLVQRTGKLAFMKCTGESIYRRMQGFTDISNAKNPKEYERGYVDEDFDRTDIIGYSPSKSYAFDRYKGNKVLDDLVNLTENELVGQSMIRSIIEVDMTTTASSGNGIWTAEAIMRDWAVIPDTDGDSRDCLTYSGSFKCRGFKTAVRVTTDDNWETLSYVEVDKSKSAFADVSIKNADGIEIGRQQGISSFSVLSVDSTTKEYTINVGATQQGAVLSIISTQGSVLASGVDKVSHTVFNQTDTAIFTITCTYQGVTNSMKVSVTVVDESSVST